MAEGPRQSARPILSTAYPDDCEKNTGIIRLRCTNIINQLYFALWRVPKCELPPRSRHRRLKGSSSEEIKDE